MLTDFQVPVSLDTSSLRPGCPDVRFTAADGVTVLPHWLQSGCGTTAAKLWLRVPSIATSTRVYAYRGHATSSGASDPGAVNLFYETFDTDPEDGGRWTNVHRSNGNTTGEFVWQADAGELWLTTATNGAGAGGTFASIAPTWEDGWAVSFRFRAGGGTGADGLGFGFFHAGSDGRGNSVGLNRSGYGIEIDSYQSQAETSANHLAVLTTVEVDAGEEFIHHQQYDTPATEDDAWHDLLVELHGGRLTVTLDDAGVVLDHTRTWDRTHRGLVFGAGTGGETNVHRVDDIVLRKAVRPPPSVTVGFIQLFDAGTVSGPSELALTLAEPSVLAGETSGLITVHVRDRAHVEVPVAAELQITFTSASRRGGFVLRAEDTVARPFVVTLPAGSASTAVAYRGFEVGMETITATAPGLTAASATLVVKANEAGGCGCGAVDGTLFVLALLLLLGTRRPFF